MSDDINPVEAEETPVVLGLLGLARHAETLEAEVAEKPPDDDKEADEEDAS